MSIKVMQTLDKDSIDMRDNFCNVMIEMAKKDKNIILLDADLMGAMGTKPFAKELPAQTVNCGIQEANMYGVAAGLSVAGKKPYAHTFATFNTRRALDQIFLSIGYARQNAKIIGSDPGVTAALNGGTHMSFEDMGNMRTIPDATVIDPTDNAILRHVLLDTVDKPGLFYIRLVRRSVIKIYDEGSTFEIGKANCLKDGTDVTIIAAGICVAEALKAAEILKDKGISAAVLDMFTIKPIDRKAIAEFAKKTGAVVTAENHSVNNGLGSAVAEVLCEESPVPMERVGSRDFGSVGSQDYLMEYYHMKAADIVKAAEKVIAKKQA